MKSLKKRYCNGDFGSNVPTLLQPIFNKLLTFHKFIFLVAEINKVQEMLLVIYLNTSTSLPARRKSTFLEAKIRTTYFW